MILICSYCRKVLGEKAPYDIHEYTHGMCSDCHDRIIRQLDGLSFDEYLEDFEFPVVIMNDEGRVAAANNKALVMLGKSMKSVKGFLGGEAFECAYARWPEGCGNTIHCPTCTVRRLINKTRDEKREFEGQKVFLTSDKGDFSMTVSTFNKDGMVQMVVTEVTSSVP